MDFSPNFYTTELQTVIQLMWQEFHKQWNHISIFKTSSNILKLLLSAITENYTMPGEHSVAGRAALHWWGREDLLEKVMFKS